MKNTLALRTALILAPLALALAGGGQLSPHQRVILESESPPPVDATFSFDAPAGPQFSEAEKAVQRERGNEVLPMVKKAFESGAGDVRIPPGDYRFGQERQMGGKTYYPLHFENMRRDAEHPFVIDATGATFWFDLDDVQMPPGHRCVGFFDCRNIVLRGAIIDRGTRGCIEGRITKIDRAGNRFEIQPSPGVVVPATYKGDQRLLPFKGDGRFCAPLYDLQQGIHKLDYQDIKYSVDGRYWITMKDPDLMARLHDADWERAFGELGMLRVGDGLSCLYTTAMALQLEDSDNLTMQGVRVYVAKGGPGESGGDGAHLWKDCFFGPRPGTSQWKGADGFLCRATRHGTTLDHVTVRHTADDLQNFHGIWGKVKEVSGRHVTLEKNWGLRPTLRNARPGDCLRFIHRQTGAFLGEAKLTAIKDFVVTLDQDATPFAEGQAEWLDHECAGWLVQHCRFEDNFQTFGMMSGPGTLRRCAFIRVGNSIGLNSGMGVVGGIPSGITIADNTFIDVNPRPHRATIEARGHNAQGKDGVPPIERLVITGNTFTRSGGPAMSLIGLKDSRIENNRIDSPVRATVIARPKEDADRQALMLRQSNGVVLKDNTLSDPEHHTVSDALSGSPLVGLEETQAITLDGRKLPDAVLRANDPKVNLTKGADKPNVLIILVDDMGFGDPRCFNPGSKIATPHIDRLAREGMRFTEAHAAASICVPSRYGLLTGRMPYRNWSARNATVQTRSGREMLHFPQPMIQHEPGRLNLATLMKRQGYATACVGKWHQGMSRDAQADGTLTTTPVDFGFDGYFGFDAPEQGPYAWIENKRFVVAPTETIEDHLGADVTNPEAQGTHWRKGLAAPGWAFEGYLSPIAEKADEWLALHAAGRGSKPFFLYYTIPAPHAPWATASAFKGKSGAGQYGDYVMNVDALVGQVMATLERLKLKDNTLVFFSSDNGPVWYPRDIERYGHRAAGPCKGMKGDLTEAGHHMPFIASWPGKIKPGSSCDEFICFTDMMATLASLLNEKLPDDAGEDSFDISPLLRGEKPSKPIRNGMVHVNYGSYTLAIREGDWKLILPAWAYVAKDGTITPDHIVETKGRGAAEKFQLYNLRADPGEATNRFAQEPDKAKELFAALKADIASGRSRQ